MCVILRQQKAKVLSDEVRSDEEKQGKGNWTKKEKGTVDLGLHFAGLKPLGHRCSGFIDAWQFIRAAELNLEFFFKRVEQIEQEI